MKINNTKYYVGTIVQKDNTISNNFCANVSIEYLIQLNST